jgi:hypothetical protein
MESRLYSDYRERGREIHSPFDNRTKEGYDCTVPVAICQQNAVMTFDVLFTLSYPEII